MTILLSTSQLDKIDSVIDLEARNERFQIRVAEVPSPEELSYTYKGKNQLLVKPVLFRHQVPVPVNFPIMERLPELSSSSL
ncbi:hypothetical protein V6N13_054387 [Hibiscus sabdariffa]